MRFLQIVFVLSFVSYINCKSVQRKSAGTGSGAGGLNQELLFPPNTGTTPEPATQAPGTNYTPDPRLAQLYKQLGCLNIGSSASGNAYQHVFNFGNDQRVVEEVSHLPGCFVPIPACHDKVDLVFLLDASGSVGRANFDREKLFIAQSLSRFIISPNDAQVGVVMFSNQPYNQFNLNQFSDLPPIVSSINQIPYPAGGTYTSSALIYARDNSFSAASGARPDARSVLVVITDGKATDSAETLQVAASLKNTSISVIAIGIGSGVDQAELSAISSGPDYVLQATSFAALTQFYDKIHEISCVVDVKTTPEPTTPEPTTPAPTTPEPTTPEPTTEEPTTPEPSTPEPSTAEPTTGAPDNDTDAGTGSSASGGTTAAPGAGVSGTTPTVGTGAPATAAPGGSTGNGTDSGTGTGSSVNNGGNGSGASTAAPGTGSAATTAASASGSGVTTAASGSGGGVTTPASGSGGGATTAASGSGGSAGGATTAASGSGGSAGGATTVAAGSGGSGGAGVVTVAPGGISARPGGGVVGPSHTRGTGAPATAPPGITTSGPDGNVTSGVGIPMTATNGITTSGPDGNVTPDVGIDINTTSECRDLIDCRPYLREKICPENSTYRAWAEVRCKVYCSFCDPHTSPKPCEDKISNCNEYGGDLCTNQLYRIFREENCQAFCSLCPGSNNSVTTPTPSKRDQENISEDQSHEFF